MSGSSGMIVQWYEQPVIPELVVANEGQRTLKTMGQLDHHLSGLIQFSLKREFFAGNPHVSQLCLNCLFWQTESVVKGQTCSASINPLQKTSQNDILGPGIF